MQTSNLKTNPRMPEGPQSGAFWLTSLMYFCSGKSMHFYSGVDTRLTECGSVE